MQDKSKPVREDPFKMPGELDPDMARIAKEYLQNFAYYKIKKDHAIKEDLYEWCSQHMGEKYRDWFVHEGGRYDKWWTVNVRNPRHSTLFALRWADFIIESVDRRQQ